MLRISRPSPALAIACLALLLAPGGGAFAAVRATGTAVNIVDPTNASRIAKVDSSGGLQVTASVTATDTAAAPERARDPEPIEPQHALRCDHRADRGAERPAQSGRVPPH
jgi:hypothetical protein